MRKFSIIAILTSVLALSACGSQDYQKEVGPNPDPGRVVKVENTELVKIQLGNTTLFYIGDKATKTCVAQTERVGSWWGTPSVSITAMPPEACGFPAKTMVIEVNLPPLPSTPKATPTPVVKKSIPPPVLPFCSAVCKAVP
jgi:hypothetical protein